MISPRSVVFDCNIFLQAMLSTRGAAYACWEKAVSGEVAVFISPFVLAEIRKLPLHKNLRGYSHFTSERVERFIEELLNVAELVADPPPSFHYPRDPDDAPYVDLAIATDSLLIVTRDKDLLDLMGDASPEGKALRLAHPEFQVVTPPQFLSTLTSKSNP